MRWFDGQAMPSDSIETPEWLDVIVYHRDQSKEATLANKDWSIVSVKACHVNYELPMAPITMMRNSLPLGKGGNGTPLVREEYVKSVEFWSEHALVR